VADEDLHAEPGQPARDGAFGRVGARHAVAQSVHDLGDGAHARAAHADEVDLLDGVFHARTSLSISSATRAAARGRASARARTAMASSAGRSRLRSVAASLAG